MTQTTANPQLCPLCGQANQCAVAANRDPATCWCMSTPINRTAVATAREQRLPQYCLCPQCGTAAPAQT
ncbi:cysteine-rich CWC family protein [Spongiibacter sp. KMU-166]|uniref:Cysteine-rich CWC family protein n=1 Tax=Spongiibacter thalassae TaxID=2721624 RepID=A0ABX1GI85_9GAMM|nr:cysteine-rich CWC family protein [Spongiibacter thalassae]